MVGVDVLLLEWEATEKQGKEARMIHMVMD